MGPNSHAEGVPSDQLEAEKKRTADPGHAVDVVEPEPIIFSLLNHPDLKAFLHPEVEGRVPVPLRITNLVSNDVDLEIFGAPVRPTEDEDQLALQLVSQQGDIAEIRIVYPAEGVTGEATLRRSEGTWSTEKISLREH